MKKMDSKEVAIFAAGCFWGVEATFRQVDGVLKTTVGYTGGHTKNPTYRDVCTDRTGHAEAVEVEFDPKKISYEELVDLFFRLHDASQINRQGPDVGNQYRSAIFYKDLFQKEIAEKVRERAQTSSKYKGKKIATEITQGSIFYPAESYHQQYFEKNGFHACVNYLPLPKK